jgi:hypothetical protein
VCRAVRDPHTLCAALCVSKAAAEAIHQAVGSVAPLEVRLDICQLRLKYQSHPYIKLKPTMDWLARHGSALVGIVTVDDESFHGSDSDSDDDSDTSVDLADANRHVCSDIIRLPLRPRTLIINHFTNSELLEAFSLDRLTKLTLSLEDEYREGYGVQNVPEVMAALAPLTGLLGLSIYSPEGWPDCDAALAPLAKLTILSLLSYDDDYGPGQKDLLPKALLHTLPASNLQRLCLKTNVEPGSTLTHLTALTFLEIEQDDKGFASGGHTWASSGCLASARLMELVGCLQPRPHPTQLPSLKELLLHQWYPSPDTPLMPYQLAALPRSLHSLELHSLTLHPASLTHLTGLTQLYLCDMFFWMHHHLVLSIRRCCCQCHCWSYGLNLLRTSPLKWQAPTICRCCTTPPGSLPLNCLYGYSTLRSCRWRLHH